MEVLLLGAKKYAYINPDMLKWAREETIFSTAEKVSMRIKQIKKEDLETWESGESLPSITDAKALAKLYDIPFAALYLKDIPQKCTKIYTDRRTLSGMPPISMSYELWKEIRYLISCRENALELIDEGYTLSSIPVCRENDSVEAVANLIRSHFDIRTPFRYKSDYKNNAFAFFRAKLESFGIMVLQISSVSLNEIRGISLSYDSLPIIAVNKADSENAKVFTIFHELAHLVRRTSALCMVNFDEQADEEEKLCDKIAAEVLLPELKFLYFPLVKNHIGRFWDDDTILTIANKFAVSRIVVIRRLYDLGKIAFDYYMEKYQNYMEDFERNKEEIKKAWEGKEFKLPYYLKFISSTGKLYPSIVLSAYSDGRMTLGEVCRTLNVKTKHISSIEQAVMYR